MPADAAPSSKPSVGTLIMAATHLGDVRDIPVRSLEALRAADLLVFEEDRPARAALKAAGVHRDYRKYSEHAQAETLAEVRAALLRGSTVLYMSDQGTPGLADPGRDLVEVALGVKARLQVIPGPSSVTAAIAACPFDCSQWHCLGFLPKEEGERLEAMRQAASLAAPLVIMDTPYRLKHLLASAAAVFGGERRAFLALDISGEREAYHLGSCARLGKDVAGLEKLNFVLIVEGAKNATMARGRRR